MILFAQDRSSKACHGHWGIVMISSFYSCWAFSIPVLSNAGLSKVAGCRWKSPPSWLLRPATLLSISLQMAFKKNIPGLGAYFDNSAVYFKSFWQTCNALEWMKFRQLNQPEFHHKWGDLKKTIFLSPQYPRNDVVRGTHCMLFTSNFYFDGAWCY